LDEVDLAAFKQATKLYAIKKEKGRQGKSCTAICCRVNDSFGSQVNAETVDWCVSKEAGGGFIPHGQFNVMVTAAETFITINQLGQDGAPKRQVLQRIANTVANSKSNKNYPDHHDDTLIDQILSELSTDFTAQTRVDKQEEQQVEWTTYSNLDT
jgi:hypothetical protein